MNRSINNLRNVLYRNQSSIAHLPDSAFVADTLSDSGVHQYGTYWGISNNGLLQSECLDKLNKISRLRTRLLNPWRLLGYQGARRPRMTPMRATFPFL